MHYIKITASVFAGSSIMLNKLKAPTGVIWQNATRNKGQIITSHNMGQSQATFLEKSGAQLTYRGIQTVVVPRQKLHNSQFDLTLFFILYFYLWRVSFISNIFMILAKCLFKNNVFPCVCCTVFVCETGDMITMMMSVTVMIFYALQMTNVLPEVFL